MPTRPPPFIYGGNARDEIIERGRIASLRSKNRRIAVTHVSVEKIDIAGIGCSWIVKQRRRASSIGNNRHVGHG